MNFELSGGSVFKSAARSPRAKTLGRSMEAAALVFLITFLAPAAAAGGSREVPRPAGYHALDVAARLEETRGPAPAPAPAEEEEEEERAWSMRVMHRDGLAGENATYEQRLAQKLARDAARLRRLLRAARPEADFGSEITSGMAEGSGEYFTRIGVGTPPREQYVVLDTGSDVAWIQCEPCSACYAQADPIFDPALSASFAGVPCGSALCEQLDAPACRGGRACLYRVAYGDGSSTLGTFATETLSFGRTSVQNVALGCGHDNEGLFVGAGGLLGLGAGPLSFPNQLGTQTGRAFSYCLVDRAGASSSTLLFGAGAVPAGAAFTALLRNPRMPTYYYVALAGISVGGSAVPLPAGAFDLDRASGAGGVIVDSGTAVTRLQPDAYEPTRDAFAAATAHLPRSDGVSLFDTCYDLSGRQSVSVPTVAFHFLDGGTLSLPAKNYLIPVDTAGTFCLAFAPTPPALSSISIIGNVQQQGIRVSFDAANSLVGFALDQC